MTKEDPAMPLEVKDQGERPTSASVFTGADGMIQPSEFAQAPTLASMERDSKYEKICRICLEKDHSSMMIAPCRCKGSSKWVHRDCLNEWRINERERAFSACTECLYEYHLLPTKRQKQGWRRKIQFSMLVSRDFFLLAFLMQAAIVFLGSLTYLCDPGQSLASSINAEDRLVAAYYLFGFALLLICLGFYGSAILCMNNCSVDASIPRVYPPETSSYGDRSAAYSRRHNHRFADQNTPNRWEGSCHSCGPGYPYCPVYVEGGNCPCWYCFGDGLPAIIPHGGTSCNLCQCCCPSELEAECIPFLCCFCLTVAIIMVFFGFLTGMVLSVFLLQRIVQRHVYLLHKRLLVQEFEVKDLAGYDLDGPVVDEERLTKPSEDNDNTEEEETNTKVPSTTHLCADDALYLRKLGLK